MTDECKHETLNRMSDGRTFQCATCYEEIKMIPFSQNLFDNLSEIEDRVGDLISYVEKTNLPKGEMDDIIEHLQNMGLASQDSMNYLKDKEIDIKIEPDNKVTHHDENYIVDTSKSVEELIEEFKTRFEVESGWDSYTDNLFSVILDKIKRGDVSMEKEEKIKTRKCSIGSKEVDVIDREFYIPKIIEKEKETGNIVVEIYGGCLNEVHNIPKGKKYILVDWDGYKEGMDEDEFKQVLKDLELIPKNELCSFCGTELDGSFEHGDHFIDHPSKKETLFICSDCLPDWEKLEKIVEFFGVEIGSYYVPGIEDKQESKCLFALCDKCKKLDTIGTNYSNQEALDKKICCNCGKELPKKDSESIDEKIDHIMNNLTDVNLCTIRTALEQYFSRGEN